MDGGVPCLRAVQPDLDLVCRAPSLFINDSVIRYEMSDFRYLRLRRDRQRQQCGGQDGQSS